MTEPAGGTTTPTRLYRSRTDRKIGGVAGGLAEYLNIDSTVVRIIFLVLLFGGGSGLLIYLVAWIAMPEAPVGYEAPPPSERAPRDGATSGRWLVGAILIGIGGWWLVRNLARDVLPWLEDLLLPLLLIGFGAAVVAYSVKK